MLDLAGFAATEIRTPLSLTLYDGRPWTVDRVAGIPVCSPFTVLTRTRRRPLGRKLYVGNLPYSVTEQTLNSTFEPHGTVESVKLITDRDTGQSKGFGFIEMGSDAEAVAAISAVNGTEVEGRAITVNEAKPQVKRSGGGGGNRGGGGGGGGGRW